MLRKLSDWFMKKGFKSSNVSPCCNQIRLEISLKKQAGLQRSLDEAEKEVEAEKENRKRERLEWEREREAMMEEITELRDNLRESCEMLKSLEGKHTV